MSKFHRNGKSFVPSREHILSRESAPIRLQILIPTRDEWDHKFGYSLARMYGLMCATLVADGIVESKIGMVNGSIIDASRNSLCKMSLKGWNGDENVGCTHQLWLDTDMIFPPDTVHRFIKANVKGVVGANYSTRRFPIHSVSYKSVPDRIHARTTAESTGLEEVDAVGMGVTWVDCEIYSKVPPPAFLSQYDHVHNNWTGEDIYFCQQVREAGYPVYIDHDLSKEVKHCGRFEFGYQHAEMWHEMSEGQPALLDADGDPIG